MRKWMTEKFKHAKRNGTFGNRSNSLEQSKRRVSREQVCGFTSFDVEYHRGNTALISHLLKQKASATVQTANFLVNLRQHSSPAPMHDKDRPEWRYSFERTKVKSQVEPSRPYCDKFGVKNYNNVRCLLSNKQKKL